jgi:hypothetical protein
MLSPQRKQFILLFFNLYFREIGLSWFSHYGSFIGITLLIIQRTQKGLRFGVVCDCSIRDYLVAVEVTLIIKLWHRETSTFALLLK